MIRMRAEDEVSHTSELRSIRSTQTPTIAVRLSPPSGTYNLPLRLTVAAAEVHHGRLYCTIHTEGHAAHPSASSLPLHRQQRCAEGESIILDEPGQFRVRIFLDQASTQDRRHRLAALFDVSHLMLDHTGKQDDDETCSLAPCALVVAAADYCVVPPIPNAVEELTVADALSESRHSVFSFSTASVSNVGDASTPLFTGELRPELRFVMPPPAVIIPMIPFRIALEVHDALGGVISGLHLLEETRQRYGHVSRTYTKLQLLLEPYGDDHACHPDDTHADKLADAWMAATEVTTTTTTTATCVSPFVPLSQLPTGRALVPPFTSIFGMLCDSHPDGCAISRVGASPFTISHTHSNRSNDNGWDAFALTKPCVAARPPLASYCGVRFCTRSRTRAVIGLLHDASSGMAWQHLTYAIHLSADATTGPLGFRLYEHGEMIEVVGTQTAQEGDVFGLQFLPNGRCVYLRNGRVCHVSARLAGEEVGFAVMVRVAYQETAPALESMTLIPYLAGPLRVESPPLLCKPQWPKNDHKTMNDRSDDEDDVLDGVHGRHAAREDRALIRAWIRGLPVDAGSCDRRVETVIFPKWVIAAASLVTTFAMGAAGGSRGGDIVKRLREEHLRAPTLQTHEWPIRPRTYHTDV